MTSQSERHNLRAIRDLLQDAFTPEELHVLFYFSRVPELQNVVQQFAPGDSMSTMVYKAVRYCNAHCLLGELLAEVKEANPGAYEKSRDTLRAKPAAAAPSARPKWLVPALAVSAAAIIISVVVLTSVLRGSDSPTPPPTEAALTSAATSNDIPALIAVDTPARSTFTSTSAVLPSPTTTDTPKPPAFTPMRTTPPLSAPTLTPLPLGAMREFIVLFDRVPISQEPMPGSTTVELVQKGARLAVINTPKTLPGARWWPILTEKGEPGWVLEWTENVRWVKPLLEVGDTVEVVSSLFDGDVTVYGLTPEGGCDTHDATMLDRGTKLTVWLKPDPDLCPPINEEWDYWGVEFWQVVVGKPLEGQPAWIADFYAPDLSEDREPVMLIAPEWYAELREK